MGGLAFLFAGQGAQKPGMGQSLCALGGGAAKAFAAMERVRPGTRASCFEGTPEHLAETEVTQPCVYTVDLAAAAALADAGVQPDAVAGFSLGEMAALAFAGAFPGADEAGGLVCLRGRLMQRAAGESPGGMAAVMKLEEAAVEALCARPKNLWPVNYNCPGQLVVAGAADELPAFCEAVRAAGGLAKRLPVGGAFHTPFMRPAAEAFAQKLAGKLRPPRLPVYANLNAAPYAGDLAATLAMQMCSPVRFSQTIRQMARDGIDTFVEVGPGKTLGGFVKRILPEAAVLNVQDAESLAVTLKALAEQGGRTAPPDGGASHGTGQ